MHDYVDFAGESRDEITRPLHSFRIEAHMNSWSEFTLALVAFFLLHSLPVRPTVKTRIVGLIGAKLFTLLYSCVSILALGWLIVGAGRAPYVEIWQPAPWQSVVTLAAMLLACLVFALAIGRPNPFSFGGSRKSSFDPTRAGIVRLHRHPLLVALLLWSSSHVLPNGDLSHLVMFGIFAVFSLVGMRLIDRRKKREIGQARYQDLLADMRRTPVADNFRGQNLLMRLIAGLALLAILLALHPAVIGVSPLAAIF
jgi:uncharacterized membrane protein